MKTPIFLLLICSFAPLVFAHGDEGAGPSRVGPDQGILKFDEHEGFVLRPSAEENFAIQKSRLKAGPIWTIPVSALVYSGLEVQVMRQREGSWQSVDVEIVRKTKVSAEIRSAGLAAGDELAIQGIGFLKIIEQSLMGPAADHHDH
ncbi:efflux RND transporter periplasmic adaptor subunit [Oligoflexus tunisiensis]|uniref:efflux RND transporter periplasmic adaptor subunit n=1 Tax=Oligoflexus tunisiensis TaxID=708132 RepID=UPI00114CEE36|nr:efflux RND transporter periplasmic adaptor subunit [Oligoflexus tunisiensis]